jgi:hypothetical protein
MTKKLAGLPGLYLAISTQDTAVGQEKQKGVKDAFAMIVAASPTTKQALLSPLSGVKVPEE